MITSIRGDIDEAPLVKTAGTDETDNEVVTWVEYRDPVNGELLHRSVHIAFKHGVTCDAVAGSL